MKKKDAFRNEGERRGMEYLTSRGHRLLAHNYLSPDRRTEIDLITIHEGVIHFVEVKAWKRGFAHPLESQTPYRILRVKRAARVFFRSYRGQLADDDGDVKKLCPESDAFCRVSFDLLWVREDGIEFFERIF